MQDLRFYAHLFAKHLVNESGGSRNDSHIYTVKSELMYTPLCT